MAVVAGTNLILGLETFIAYTNVCLYSALATLRIH